MDEPTQRSTRGPGAVVTGESPLMTLVSAALFLYVGFGYAPVGITGNAIYDGSCTVVTWMGRIVGSGLLAVAGMALARFPGATYVDLGLSGIAAAGCLVAGLIWMAFGDMNGILLLLFGILNGSAARGAWQRMRSRTRLSRAIPLGEPDERPRRDEPG
jgi:hypothetical protein